MGNLAIVLVLAGIIFALENIGSTLKRIAVSLEKE